MLLATLTFDEPINSSLQIGDIVYYSPTSLAPNSNIPKTITANVIKLGPVHSIGIDPIVVRVTYDNDPGNSGSSTVFAPPANSYIMFEKDKQVNSSSLMGYYANVKLMNDSTSKIELFSLGSEVTESSK